MNLETYLQETQRTLPDLSKGTLDSEIINSVHMAMGMNDEIGELFDHLNTYSFKLDKSKITDESGDQLWYISNYSTIRNLSLISFPIVINGLNEAKALVQDRSYKILGLEKKCFAYGKKFDKTKAQILLSELYAGVLYILNYCKIDPEEVFEKNINKLRIRFPEKFDAELVLNKNEEEEKKVFK